MSFGEAYIHTQNIALFKMVTIIVESVKLRLEEKLKILTEALIIL